MKRQHILLPAIAISLLLLQLTFAASPRYEVIDLGTLGGNFSCAYSINDSGQIVGDSESSSGHRLATLFDPTGRGNNINLGTLGGDASWARSIADGGQIVGYARTRYNLQATLFDPSGNGNNTNLGTLFDDKDSWAYSINNSGQIVGDSRWDCGPHGGPFCPSWGAHRATLFDPTGNGPNIQLGTLGGGRSTAYSINNSGQIVGVASDGLVV